MSRDADHYPPDVLHGLATLMTALLSLNESPLPAPPTESAQVAAWAADRDSRMAWWRDARFGMFIHWGLYSGAGGVWDGKVYPQHYAEWIQHWAAVPCAEYARQMRPLFVPAEGFADAWAQLAKDAGMRYAVLTSKHHDGFTLFNSAEPYSVGNPITVSTNISPKGRDVAREFADAMRAQGLRPGFYYSLLDWQHPDAYEMALPACPRPAPRDHGRYRAYMRGQSYRTVEAGRVMIPVGSHAAVLRALSKPGEAVMNVRAIRLLPVRPTNVTDRLAR